MKYLNSIVETSSIGAMWNSFCCPSCGWEHLVVSGIVEGQERERRRRKENKKDGETR
jgi:hypothetical protein